MLTAASAVWSLTRTTVGRNTARTWKHYYDRGCLQSFRGTPVSSLHGVTKSAMRLLRIEPDSVQEAVQRYGLFLSMVPSVQHGCRCNKNMYTAVREKSAVVRQESRQSLRRYLGPRHLGVIHQSARKRRPPLRKELNEAARILQSTSQESNNGDPEQRLVDLEPRQCVTSKMRWTNTRLLCLLLTGNSADSG